MPTLEEKSKQIGSGFAQVPNFMILTPRVSMEARFLFVVLRAFAWDGKTCFPGQKRLAGILDKSTDYVQKLLKELRDRNFISWKRRGLGMTNLYTLNIRNKDWDASKLTPSTSGITTPKDNGTNYTKFNNTQIYNSPERKSMCENFLLKGTGSAETPTAGGKPEPDSESRTNKVTLLSQLKRIREKYEISGKKYGFEPEDFKTASEAVVYYESGYRQITGNNHPRYVVNQLESCVSTLLTGIKRINEEGLPMDILFEAINYWFSTTPHDQNNLRLNHFAGGEYVNSILDNCIDGAIYNRRIEDSDGDV